MKTDWKEDILAPSMDGKRRYHIYENEDASISLIDSTQYDQVGDIFGAEELNQIGEEINNTVGMLTEAVQLAQASAESAQASADKASEFTPDGYDAFVSSTESHLSTLDESVESLQDKIGNHENLLDNPWFTVNQRGQSEYSGTNVYSVDRWKVNGCTVSISDKITISNTNSATKYFYNIMGSNDMLLGKVVTLSVLLADGRIFKKTEKIFSTLPDANDTTIIHITDLTSNLSSCDFFYRKSIDSFIVQFNVRANDTISVLAVKLELDTVSTLANDTPPNYELEKYKCTMSTADSADTYANGGMIKGTLSAGSTSITLTDSRITTNSIFRFFTSKFGVSPTGATVNNGSIILTFEAQSEPITVGVKLE